MHDASIHLSMRSSSSKRVSMTSWIMAKALFAVELGAPVSIACRSSWHAAIMANISLISFLDGIGVLDSFAARVDVVVLIVWLWRCSIDVDPLGITQEA